MGNRRCPPIDGAHAKRPGSRYVLGDLLGRGGMAEVFAGHSVGDHGFQKPVAIKRLLPELANDEVFVDRLIEEARRAPANRDAGKHRDPGTLSVESTPWSWVTIDGQRKETLDKFSLAPGTYSVKFFNEANGLIKYERVTVESGKRLKLDEEMRR